MPEMVGLRGEAEERSLTWEGSRQLSPSEDEQAYDSFVVADCWLLSPSPAYPSAAPLEA